MDPRIASEELIRSGVLVRIPSALLSFTGGQDEVLLEATDFASLVARLDVAFPGVGDRILDEAGRLRQCVNVFVNDELVRGAPDRLRLSPGDQVHILPSVAGGCLG
ncbi:MAG: MoaD/ThiS family protein [Candidatus Thermoplasmatota archaeon]